MHTSAKSRTFQFETSNFLPWIKRKRRHSSLCWVYLQSLQKHLIRPFRLQIYRVHIKDHEIHLHSRIWLSIWIQIGGIFVMNIKSGYQLLQVHRKFSVKKQKGNFFQYVCSALNLKLVLQVSKGPNWSKGRIKIDSLNEFEEPCAKTPP